MYFSLFWLSNFENSNKYDWNNKPGREELAIQTPKQILKEFMYMQHKENTVVKDNTHDRCLVFGTQLSWKVEFIKRG